MIEMDYSLKVVFFEAKKEEKPGKVLLLFLVKSLPVDPPEQR